jgi:hypothetical protein
MTRERARSRPAPRLLWVDAADYEPVPERPVDPAPLARLLDAWYRSASASSAPEAPAREVAEDADDGPVHLARLVAALETSARATGGSLARISDTPAVTRECGGALHHLIEVLHDSGLRAATAVARDLDPPTRLRVLSALRPYWQSPLRALSTPMRDAQLRSPGPLWGGRG